MNENSRTVKLTEDQLDRQALYALADAASDIGDEPAYAFLLAYKMGWKDGGGVVIDEHNQT